MCLYKTQKGEIFPENVALKFDPSIETANLKETLILKDLTKRIDKEGIKINIPKYYMHSFYKGRRFFVMTYLPESINDFINSRGYY